MSHKSSEVLQGWTGLPPHQWPDFQACAGSAGHSRCPQLEPSGSAADGSKWDTQQNPACCLYLREDGKQIFWQLSDTPTFPPALVHQPAQSQKLLLLLPRMHTSLSKRQPSPSPLSYAYLPGVDSPCRNVPSHWRCLHRLKCPRNGKRIGQMRYLEWPR